MPSPQYFFTLRVKSIKLALLPVKKSAMQFFETAPNAGFVHFLWNYPHKLIPVLIFLLQKKQFETLLQIP